MPPILNKFTTHLREVLAKATNFAAGNRARATGPEHLLYALGVQKGSIAYEILQKANLNLDKVRESIQLRDSEAESQPASSAPAKPTLTLESKSAIEKSGVIAAKYNHRYVGTEHLLYGLLKLQTPFVQKMWREQSIDPQEMLGQVVLVLRSTSKFPDITELFEDVREAKGERRNQSKTPALDFFATDLTNPKLQATIDPVIGRQAEIDRLVHILSRRTKNNPVLLGDPGVGKTAIVEGLAKKVVSGDVPEALQGKRILRLDLSLIVAGTMYRGEFESRLKQIIEEITADPNLIVFIDEIHTIIGAGAASGSMDAANILKPALARGELRVIGATTLDEYRKHIESDAALERRFQPIVVPEPSIAETELILEGLRPNYERFHQVRITREAIAAAVELSERYIQDKFLPDKAIDLIDEAAAKRKVERGGSPEAKKIRVLEQQLEDLERQKDQAVLHERFEEALTLKATTSKLREKLAQLTHVGPAKLKSLATITRKDIADVVSRITNIPLRDLVSEERDRLLKLEDRLKAHVIGQEEASHAIADAIRRSRVGLRNQNRPIGSFIFMGPSGVGKTEMAKVLAREIYEDESALIRVDMSEFGESFNVSKLIGAPAGYVGYKEGNKLTEPVRRKPYAVVLFDEVEKAHPDVFNLLLQVLEDGQLTDGTGKVVNFKNTIIIFTSNVGLESLNQTAKLGFTTSSADARKEAEQRFAETSREVTDQLHEQFRPEFLNRIDKIIVFRPLTAKDVKQIVQLQAAELQALAAAQGFKLTITAAALKRIAELGFSPEQGARAIRKVIQDEVENPLARAILERKFARGAVITVNAGKHSFTIR